MAGGELGGCRCGFQHQNDEAIEGNEDLILQLPVTEKLPREGEIAVLQSEWYLKPEATIGSKRKTTCERGAVTSPNPLPLKPNSTTYQPLPPPPNPTKFPVIVVDVEDVEEGSEGNFVDDDEDEGDEEAGNNEGDIVATIEFVGPILVMTWVAIVVVGVSEYYGSDYVEIQATRFDTTISN
ncbi:hypothetical protein BYT27DRAFT_7249755 [Phlegmacium glaucopus]|nr:hypothetical protein BYT27DRAFT_7249755 [Phlegmacium glaucopus]